MSKQIDIFREKIAESIGGRKKAAQFEQQTAGRFRRRTLQNWIDGDTSPTVEQLLELARETGKKMSFFLPLQPAPSSTRIYRRVLNAKEDAPEFAVQAPESAALEITRIPIVETSISAHSPHVVVQETGNFYFPTEFLEKLGATKPETVEALRIKDDAMAPTIKKGALAFIDYARAIPAPDAIAERDNDIYAFLVGMPSELCVRRLRNTPSGLYILSDNNAVPPQFFPADAISITILGKVIWWDNRL